MNPASELLPLSAPDPRSPSRVRSVHRPQRLIVAALGDIIDSIVDPFQRKKTRRYVARIDDTAAGQFEQLGKIDVVPPGDAADLDGTNHQIAHRKIERLGVSADQRHAASAFQIPDAFNQGLYAARG